MAFHHTAERYRVFIPEGLVVISLPFIQEKGFHFALQCDFFIQRTEFYVVQRNAVPDDLKSIRQIARQFHLFLDTENVFFVDSHL